MNITNTFSRKIGKVVSSILMLGMLVTSFAFLPQKVQAATVTGDVHGYVWTSTLGWISLNCAEGGPGGASNCSTSNYKVTVTADRLSGYAWGDNVGWVSFNTAAVATCGSSGSGILDDATGNITGWARALSGIPGTAGNGCISLGGSGYGVHYDSSTFSTLYPSYHPLAGFAWGDASMGWADFGYAAIDGGTTAPNIFCVKSLYPDQSFIPGNPINPHRKIAEYSCKNTSLTESIGFTNLTIGITPTTLGISDITNLKIGMDGTLVGTNLPSPTDAPAGNVRNVAPRTLLPGKTVLIQLYSDIGTDPAGSFTTNLLAQANGLSTGTAYTSGTAVVGQTNTIRAPLPPGTIDFDVNGVSTFAFPTSSGGPATFSWSTAPDITSCTGVRDTIDPSETYWDSTHPSSLALRSGFSGPLTIPANTTHSVAAHIFGINCSSPSGPHSATVEVDVPPVMPAVDLKVNGVDGPITMPYGGAVSLSWNSSDVTVCSVDPDAGGYVTDPTYWPVSTPLPLNQALPPGWIVVTPTAPGHYKYGIDCHGSGAPVKDMIEIVIAPSTALPGTTTGGTGGGGTGGITRPPWHEI